MSKTRLSAGLNTLRDENPKKLVSLVRLFWPDIKAALDRGHSVKVIHERFVKNVVRISYRLFAMYVGQLRREGNQATPGEATLISNEMRSDQAFVRTEHSVPVPNMHRENDAIAVVRVPKRRLFSAKAAAQYLGVHEQTLKKITGRGELQARRIGLRRVYCLEDLDRYIESLPLSA